MNCFGINLQKLLEKEDISENEFSKRIGISQQSINKIITGQSLNPRLSTLVTIADYFKIPLQQMISNHIIQDRIQIPAIHTVSVPFVDFDDLNMSGLETAIMNSKKYINVELSSKDNCFATSMYDESMEPKFSIGSVLVFNKDKKLNHGDFCLLKGEDEQYMFRQVLINSSDKKFIKCLNPKFLEYNSSPLSVNLYVLATLFESRTIYSNQ